MDLGILEFRKFWIPGYQDIWIWGYKDLVIEGFKALRFVEFGDLGAWGSVFLDLGFRT